MTIAVTVKPETDGLVIGPILSSGLVGTLEDSIATVDITFPTSGVYYIETRVTFELP